MMRVVSTPLSILLAAKAGGLGSSKPFPIVAYCMLFGMLISTYNVLVLLATFPAKEDISYWTSMHVMAVSLVSDLVSGFEFVTAFGILL